MLRSMVELDELSSLTQLQITYSAHEFLIFTAPKHETPVVYAPKPTQAASKPRSAGVIGS